MKPNRSLGLFGLITLLAFGTAFAQNTTTPADTVVITSPSYNPKPVGLMRVTPTGGTQGNLSDILAQALAGGGSGVALSITGSGSNTLAGITSINFGNCALTGTSPNATVTCSGGGTTYTGTAPIFVNPSTNVISAPTVVTSVAGLGGPTISASAMNSALAAASGYTFTSTAASGTTYTLPSVADTLIGQTALTAALVPYAPLNAPNFTAPTIGGVAIPVIGATSGTARDAAAAIAAEGNALAAGILAQKKSFFLSQYGGQSNGVVAGTFTTTAGSTTVSYSGFTAADATTPAKLISIYAGASSTLTGGATTVGSEVVTVASTTALGTAGAALVNNVVIYNTGSNTQIPQGARVTGILNSTQFSIYPPATGTGSGLSFTANRVFNSTIVSATAGSATLATAPTTSMSGNAYGMYGSDDTNAYEAADAAAVAAGGGTIILPPGITVVSPLNNSTNPNHMLVTDGYVSVIGAGRTVSQILPISTADEQVPVIESRTQYNNVVNSGLTNWATVIAQSNNYFSDFTINGMSETNTGGTYYVQAKGFGFTNSINSIIQRVGVQFTPATCIATDNSSTWIEDSVIESCGISAGLNAGGNGVGEGVGGYPWESYFIRNVIATNCRHYCFFAEEQAGGATRHTPFIVTGTTSYEGYNSGSVTAAATTTPTAAIGNSGSIDAVFSDNEIIGLGTSTASLNWNGISEDSGTVATSNGSFTNSSGNNISGVLNGIVINYANVSSGTKAQFTSTGDNVTGVTGAAVLVTPNATSAGMKGLTFTGEHFTLNGGCGIEFKAATTANPITLVSIHGGQIWGNGTSTANDWEKAAVCVSAPSTNATPSSITGFTMSGVQTADGGGGTQKYGLSVNTGSIVLGARLSGNDLSGNTTSPFDMLGTVSGVLDLMETTTFSGLLSCTSGLAGSTEFITDATSPTWNGAITGGGAVFVKARCNGTNWVSI